MNPSASTVKSPLVVRDRRTRLHLVRLEARRLLADADAERELAALVRAGAVFKNGQAHRTTRRIRGW
jgi:hypothetical protein